MTVYYHWILFKEFNKIDLTCYIVFRVTSAADQSNIMKNLTELST